MPELVLALISICIALPGAALPHLTADDLRHTPAGRALMAEAWRRGYRDRQNDYGAADVTPCPYQDGNA